MADKTQINLERIRVCDADWEETKHPRSENGQFTSGSGGGSGKADYESLTKKQNDLFHKVVEASRKYGKGSKEHKAARAEYDKAYSEWAKADEEHDNVKKLKNVAAAFSNKPEHKRASVNNKTEAMQRVGELYREQDKPDFEKNPHAEEMLKEREDLIKQYGLTYSDVDKAYKMKGETAKPKKANNIHERAETTSKELRDRLESIGKKLEILAKKRSYSGSEDDEKNSNEYYKVQKQYNEARSALNAQLDKEAAERKKRPAPQNEKTFVNSFGEATKRDITNSTYRRQQKQQQKEIERLIGGK